MPHPQMGVDDISRHIGRAAAPSTDGTLRIALASGVASNPFRTVARDRLAGASGQKILPLAEDATLAGSVRPVLAAMLHSGEPSIERVARSGGMSVRSLQRRLAQEGTSFSDELDRVRRRLALSLLQSDDMSLAELTDRLGYSSPQALSRAVWRMVGASPGRVRAQEV
mgnify:FL=1